MGGPRSAGSSCASTMQDHLAVPCMITAAQGPSAGALGLGAHPASNGSSLVPVPTSGLSLPSVKQRCKITP